MCGMDKVSFEDLKDNCVINQGRRNNIRFQEVLSWFWTVVSSFTQEEMARLLQFVTGCSQLPPGGFKELEPRFTITPAPTRGRLPTAHTWYVLDMQLLKCEASYIASRISCDYYIHVAENFQGSVFAGGRSLPFCGFNFRRHMHSLTHTHCVLHTYNRGYFAGIIFCNKIIHKKHKYCTPRQFPAIR